VLSRIDLHPYQQRAAAFAFDHPACALWLGLGLGKTISTLTAVADLIDACASERVLIIAPLRVANSVWKQEASNWAHTSHLRVSVCTGSEKARTAALNQDADLYIINRENVVWLVKHYGKRWPFDTVVIDEASSFKSSKAKRWRALKRVRPLMRRVIELTGTMSPNGLIDLWAQVYLLDQGKRLGRTKTGFLDRWFESDYMGYNWTPREQADEEIHAAVSDIVLCMEAKDYLDLPQRMESSVVVTMTQKHQREYEQLEREFLLQLEGSEVEAFSAGALAGKLLQFCIAKGTRVVTDRGAIPIEDVRPTDKVWDGDKWVSCSGSVYNGYKKVVSCYGIAMTPGHKVLTRKGWRMAAEVIDGKPSERLDREYLRNPDRVTACWIEKQKSGLVMSMPMRQPSGAPESKPSIIASGKGNEVVRVSYGNLEKNPRHEPVSPVYDLAEYDQSVLQSKGQRLSELRRKGHNGLPKLARIVRKLLGGYARRVFRESNDRQGEQCVELFKRKLPMGYCKTARPKHKKVHSHMDTGRPNEFERSGGTFWNKSCDSPRADFPLQNGKRKVVQEAGVYDLINCGPNNRFTVVDDFDQPVIVHNCNGAIYTDESGAWSEIHNTKLDALAELIEDNPGEPLLVAYNFRTDLARIRERFPHAETINAPDAIDRWNRGEIPLLLAHPASAGHGLNLQHGGCVIVWFGLNWSLELYQQFNGRLDRQGQTRPVRIIHIVTEGTIDERVLGAVRGKAQTQQDLIEAVKMGAAIE